MLLVIDNYDSFTYNLVQYLGELGEDVRVVRNDAMTVDEIAALKPSRIVISPGPCTPKEAGVSIETIKRLAGAVPILGVCLGHQSIGEAFGGDVVRAERLMHGKTSQIKHDGRTIFRDLPCPFEATRYHSLIVKRETLPSCLEISAETAEGEIMGLRHRTLPVEGVQFHPESILTRPGKDLLRNFLSRYPPPMIKDAIAKVVDRLDLTEAEAEAAMHEIMEGQATPAQIAAYVTALRMKGEAVDEVTGSARAMRAKAVRIHTTDPVVVDTCGTGGDGGATFNVSTAVAFVVAGAGVTVAKHGNRAVSSRSGSADVLKALGVRLDLPPERAEECVNEIGIGFLFAPLFHGAMKHAVGPRQEIGVRTIFNLLGPLTNPASASIQIVGVYHEALTDLLAKVLMRLGGRHCYVVHGMDGLDEITLADRTRVSEGKAGRLTSYMVEPRDFGLQRVRAKDLEGGDAEENAQITRDILSGREGPRQQLVLVNAPPALVACGKAATFQDGVALARTFVQSGAAMAKLGRLIKWTNR